MMAVVGARICVDGHYGTVKYTGEVQSTEGEWLGVDWDNPKRGKHDGTKDSIRYFTTSHPTSGSFIRSKKVDFGIDFMTAVKERYGAIEDDNAGVIVEDMYVCGKNQKTTVEVVGAKSVNRHQSQLNQLQEVALRGMPVSTAGADGSISLAMSNVKELDVSDTLIPSWLELARIASQLPQLEILNISDTRLDYETATEKTKNAFLHVKTVTANRCHLTWKDVICITTLLPALETLHVCFNRITDISLSGTELQNLKFLNLEGNRVEKWNYVLQLSNLPKLETLILNDIGIDQIELSDVAKEQSSQFAKLKALSVFHNKITNWTSINELNKLAGLVDLKFRFNPLTQDTKLSEETLRSIMIAKIAKLKTLNRSLITDEERHGAELDYMRTYGKEWKAAGGNQDKALNNPNQDFILKHPRYQALVDALGACEDAELEVKTSALKNNLISVNIECPFRPDTPVLVKKIPVTMTVQKLKAMAQRWFDGHTPTLTLTYSTPRKPDQEYGLDNDMRDISYFAVADGDTIHVKWSD